MIELDPIKHSVRTGGRLAVLQPLTFLLFKKLHEEQNQTVSIEALTHDVWEGVTVSPDALKQRVFLLRKDLEKAGMDPHMVQSVRGKGYRLAIAENTAPWWKSNRLGSAVAAVGLLLLVTFVVRMALISEYQPPDNNRAVFWVAGLEDSSLALGETPVQAWRNKLTGLDRVNFVYGDFNADQGLAQQARGSRAAIVSFWEFYSEDDKFFVRMQIIEPKSAVILRSDVAGIANDERMQAVMHSQARVIDALLASGLLPLTREQLTDTSHPVWDQLRKISNPA